MWFAPSQPPFSAMNIRPLLVAFSSLPALTAAADLPYPVVDTAQDHCYDNRGEIQAPKPGQPFYGQDAQYQSHPPSYTLSPDGLTAKDNVTGLVWQRSPETNGDGTLSHADKLTWDEALARPAKLNAARFGGFSDWRLPTIKEIYSLFDGRGTDPSGLQGDDTSGLTPFIDTKVFKFIYGDPANGARIIDAQYASSTKYTAPSPRGGDKVFGVNFADGRIKGYDQSMPGGNRKFRFFVLCTRGNPQYGRNDFKDNGNGTVTDRATGLTWAKADSGKGLDWEQSLAWVARMNAENHLGHNDWRLPDVKELQSIVDYSRSPDTTRSPAINPALTCSETINEAGKPDYPCYWSATTHIGHLGGAAAMYVAFGRAGGFMAERSLAGAAPQGGRPNGPGGGPQATDPNTPVRFVDVHGAGAQRSDPKAGDPKQFPRGRGPQGDAIRIHNHVRLVRGGNVVPAKVAAPGEPASQPAPFPEGPPSAPATPNRPNTPAARPFPASPIVAALDINHDGTITADELAKAAESLKSLDKNRDGSLTEDEFRPQRQGPPGPGLPAGPPP
jgi:hypothetical protein